PRRQPRDRRHRDRCGPHVRRAGPVPRPAWRGGGVVIAATPLGWDTARAGGIVSWCLLAASVLWGLAISTKATTGRVRPNWMLDLHRFLGGPALLFVGVHVVGLVADSYVQFGPAELVVPFVSDYRPAAVAWGIV